MTRQLHALLLTLACLLALADAASANNVNLIQFRNCAINVVKQVDPLVDFGSPMSGHVHAQWGADVFAYNETMSDMLGTGATTCPLPSDRTSSWQPEPVKADGSAATLLGAQSWIQNSDYRLTLPTTTAGVSAWDPGLRYVKGDHACTEQSCGSAIFKCIKANGGLAAGSVGHVPAATDCAAPYNAGYAIAEYSTNNPCWDPSLGVGGGMGGSGQQLDYNKIDFAPAAGDPPVCPSGTRPVAGFVSVLVVAADGYGGCLSSDVVASGGTVGESCAQAGVTDPGASAHADVVFGMPAGDMARIDQYCLNAEPITGTTCSYKTVNGVTALWTNYQVNGAMIEVAAE